MKRERSTQTEKCPGMEKKSYILNFLPLAFDGIIVNKMQEYTKCDNNRFVEVSFSRQT